MVVFHWIEFIIKNTVFSKIPIQVYHEVALPV
jgi:hypothetical protein